MKHITNILFILYSSLLLYIVFFSRRRNGLIWSNKLVNLVPIRHTIRTFSQIEEIGIVNFLSNIFGNIIIFIPLAFFLVNIFGVYTKRQIIVIGFCISFSIEFIQFLLEIGVPDIDDLLLNVTGVVIGIYLYKILWSSFRNQTR
ncbi:VanZ family protein [Hymenobacter tibetensis]|uniref:VanZ family protein n=1 Tax=Hymenobacter tibetensis TaxID=497967 RepID=UPI00374D917E